MDKSKLFKIIKKSLMYKGNINEKSASSNIEAWDLSLTLEYNHSLR